MHIVHVKNPMKLKRIFRVFLLLSLTGAACSLQANIEVTSPVWVASATTIQGNGGSGTKLTAFSQRFVLPVLYAGTISGVQGSTLTDTNAAWADGEFGTNGVVSYVEFDNGWMADISTSIASNSSLSLAGSLSGIATAGNTYRVRAHLTIASIFGTNNEVGLQSGESAAQADNIILTIPQSQQNMVIYYYSNQYFHGWLRGDLSPASTQVVYPEQGLMVRRIASGDRVLPLVGVVKTGVTVAPVDPGYNLVGTLHSMTNLTLAQLSIYTGNPATGLAGGVTAASSDNLLVFQANGSVATYYYYYQPGIYQGWLDGNLSPSDNVPIAAGSAFFIKRLTANGPFNWTIPAE